MTEINLPIDLLAAASENERGILSLIRWLLLFSERIHQTESWTSLNIDIVLLLTRSQDDRPLTATFWLPPASQHKCLLNGLFMVTSHRFSKRSSAEHPHVQRQRVIDWQPFTPATLTFTFLPNLVFLSSLPVAFYQLYQPFWIFNKRFWPLYFSAFSFQRFTLLVNFKPFVVELMFSQRTHYFRVNRRKMAVQRPSTAISKSLHRLAFTLILLSLFSSSHSQLQLQSVANQSNYIFFNFLNLN